MIKDLGQAVQLSLKANGSKEHEADFTVEIDREDWKCYTVAIAHHDLLLYCDRGTATLLVDVYNGTPRVEVFDWNREN